MIFLLWLIIYFIIKCNFRIGFPSYFEIGLESSDFIASFSFFIRLANCIILPAAQGLI